MHDMVAINNFVATDLQIPPENIENLLDRSAEDIQNTLNQLIVETDGAHKAKSRGFIFFYYSGHGCQINADTYGLDKSGKPFELSQCVRKLRIIPSHFTIAVFDCCRTKAIQPDIKGFTTIELQINENPSYGQACMIFGSKSGYPAISRPNEISFMTSSFLQHVKKYQNSTFPLCLQDWTFLVTKGEYVHGSNMQINLFPKEDNDN